MSSRNRIISGIMGAILVLVGYFIPFFVTPTQGGIGPLSGPSEWMLAIRPIRAIQIGIDPFNVSLNEWIAILLAWIIFLLVLILVFISLSAYKLHHLSWLSALYKKIGIIGIILTCFALVSVIFVRPLIWPILLWSFSGPGFWLMLLSFLGILFVGMKQEKISA